MICIKSKLNEIFPSNLLDVGYEDNREYLDDNLKMVKMMINCYKECTGENTFAECRKLVKEDFYLAELFIASRLKNTDKKLSLYAEHIKGCFSLNALEWFCFLMSLIFDTDHNYKALIQSLSGEESIKVLDYEIIMKIFYFVENFDEIEYAYSQLINLKFKMSSLCFTQHTTKIDDNILSFLYFGEKKTELSGVDVYVPDNDETGALPVRERIANRIFEISKLRPEEKQFCFYLHGEAGIGKRTLAKRASELMVKGTIIIDMKLYALLSSETFYKLIYSPLREALIINGNICLANFEIFNEMSPQKYEYLEFLMENVPKFSREMFILSNKEVSNLPVKSNISVVNIPLESLSSKENSALWKSYLRDLNGVTKVSAKELANKFNFTPAQMKFTMDSARSLWYWKGCKELKIKDMCKCAYSNSISKLSTKSTIIKSRYTWKNLVLDRKEKNMIRSACDQIKYRNIVYDEWGMDSRILYGRGLSMLFAGPPGTGKTMAAQVVANELNLELYKTDLSQVVSKYIGETEKNLNELFNEAKKSNVILFFDETDALFGKRTTVKDSHDKNANLETSFLLQKMEEYDGVSIMTTNYLENIDVAFFRRISYVIHFAFPDALAREKIWKNMFSSKTPLSPDIDFKYLSKNFEMTGGSIKNIAVNAAFMAARDSKEVKMEHILKSLIYEVKKQGKNVIKDDLGEYGYLLK